MPESHFINLEQVSLSDYKRVLEKTELFPGRKLLREKMSQRFEGLSQDGVSNLQELFCALKAAKRLNHFSEKTGIPADYLKILKRYLHRFLPKSFLLKAFPGINKALIKKLKEMGIINTIQLLQIAETKKKQIQLSKETEVNLMDLQELVKLADILRIWGLEPVFCRIFYETGTDTVKKIAQAHPPSLYEQLTAVNEKKGFTRAKFSAKDVKFVIETAQGLPRTVED